MPRAGKPKIKNYGLDFKLRAVQLSIQPGVLVKDVADSLGIQLQKLGMVQSMNRPGRMNDNAHMGSFFHSMKCEELYGKKFDNEQQLRSYIRFYNERRLHSSLQYLPPAAYESRVYGEPSVN